MKSNAPLGSCTLALSVLLAACSTQGPDQIVSDRFDYNNAVATSANEQMLLNLVRLRYQDIPTFLQVNSVLTQYIWSANLGIEGSGGASLGFDQYLVGAAGTIRYVERPTITYTPLTGEEFAKQLTTPVPTDLIFSLVQSGWPPEQLLLMGLRRFHDLQNIVAGYAGTLDQDVVDRFRQTTSLFVEVAKRSGMEAQMSAEEEGPRLLVFDDDADLETQQMIDDFKATLGLPAETSAFKITTRVIGRAPDEVTIRVRSILDIMGFLALGVEAPPEHIENGRVAEGLDMGLPEDGTFVPLHVLTATERPTSAFVAVRYAGHWFYIPNSDLRGKQAFGMLSYLFQMQAPRIQGAGPLITVSTG